MACTMTHCCCRCGMRFIDRALLLSVFTRHVLDDRLDFGGCCVDLRGFLPTEIGTFTALELLNMNGQSHLKGSLPTELGRLSALTTL